MSASNIEKLCKDWSALKASQLIPWRYNLRRETANANFNNKKIRMNRKIRKFFPRGKKFDQVSKHCIALPKDLQSEE